MMRISRQLCGWATGWTLACTSAAVALPPGWTSSVFAGPPAADYPAAISAAANGDVYISSDPNGSLGKDPKFGRIIVARDTDGDGKADNFKDFVPHVKSPRGGHYIGGTYYLIHPPYLTSYRDTNGDGVADEDKLLVEGFGWGIEHPRGADHTTNGVRMGIDGWLYVSVGDFGMPNAKGADGSRYTLHGGGVARVRPDGSELEPYSLMVRNIVDTAISPTLDLFSRDNTNDGKGWNTRFHHFMALQDHGYPRLYQHFKDEIISPLADYGGGSGTGALYLSEPGIPKEFNDTVYTADWTTGNIYHHPLTPFEATFKAGQEIFAPLPRAIDIDVDGSSRLYLADWRNGGYNYDASKQVGLIQRVLPPNWKPRPFPDLKKMTDLVLVQQIASDSSVMRLEAQREILARGQKKIFADGLFAIAKDRSEHLYPRVAAVFTFKQLYGATSTAGLVTLSEDPSLREFALRAMADRKSELKGVPTAPFLTALKDPNPRVQVQALIGLARLGAVDAAPAILASSSTWDMAKSGSGEEDPHIVAHIGIKALVSLKASAACLEALGKPAEQTAALRALQEMSGPEVAAGLIEAANRAKDPAQLQAILGALARLYHQEAPWDLKDWWNTRPDDRGPYFAPVEWAATPKIRATIEALFPKIAPAQRADFMELMARNRLPVSQLKLDNVDPLVRALAAESPDNATLVVLMDAAKDKSRPWDKRVAAYAAIGKATPDRRTFARVKVLGTWLEQNPHADASQHVADFVNETARGEEIARLITIGKGGADAESRLAWRAMITVLNSPLANAKSKAEVRQRLDAMPNEVGLFLAIADMKAPGFDKQIDAGIHSDNERTIHAAQAAQKAGATATASGRKVAEMPPAEVTTRAMTAKGDPAVGSRLFVSQGCIACHAIDPSALQKGPYLGAAGAKFQRDYLIESILDPNAVVAQGFQTAMFQMNDGSAKMGFVTKEEDGVIEIRDIAGQTSTLQRSEVKAEEHLPQSMMPPGLGSSLTIEDFTSLIEYLVSLKSTGG